MFQSANMAWTLCPLLTSGAVELLQAHASAEQKRRYLPRLVSGEWTCTMNLTEPQAGSDVGALRTKAVRAGDHYKITGQKIFITFGDHDFTDNIIHMVLARTPDAPPGSRGISLFIVPKIMVAADGTLQGRNDLRCVSLEHKLGISGAPTAVMAFGDNGGATGFLVGEENRGLEYMFTMMNNARLSVGLQERRDRRARLPAGARLCPRARPEPGAWLAKGRFRGDHPPPGRAAHADDDEGGRGGGARPHLHHDVRPRPVAAPSRPGGARAPACPGRSVNAGGQGVVHRFGCGDCLHRHPGAWRHGLHRGDRRGPTLARRPHRPHL